MNPDPNDPDVIALTKAIFQHESGMDFNAVGDAGTSHGAGQWQPETWKAQAQEVLGDPNAEMSPQNQKAVAQYEIAKDKAAGLNPAQIAAKWNSGSPTGWEDKIGTTTINGQQIKYNVPAYVKAVTDLYQQYKGQAPQSNLVDAPFQSNQPETQVQTQVSGGGGLPTAPTAPTPLLSAQQDLAATTQQPQSDNLGTELSNRVQEGTQAASEGISAATKGDVFGAFSGALQTAGAAAGAVGDVVNAGIDLIPGVKQVEGLLGQGIGALAQTPTGQKVTQAIENFSNQNPELAKDIGAGFNIVTAIPILRGLGVAADIGGDAIAQGLKGVAEKSFVDSAPDIIGSTKGGARFMDANPTVAQDMVDRRMVGDIQGGEFTTKASAARSWQVVKNLNAQVNEILSRPEFATQGQDGVSIAQKAIQGFTDRNGNIIEGIPESNLTPQELIENAKKLDPNKAALWDKFEAGQANWQEINKLRSSLDTKVKKIYIGKASIDSPEVATSKENGALLSGAMRDSLQQAAPQTAVPFKEMSTQFKIQKALELMNGKKVKPGTIAKLAGHAAGIGAGGSMGALIGGAPGAVIGGMIGDRTAGAVAERVAGKRIVQGILKRTGVNATRTAAKKAIPTLAGAAVSAAAQKMNR